MRRLYLLLIFLISFPIFLYFSFPIERFVEGELCKRGINYKKVEIERLPLKIKVQGLKLSSLPFSVEEALVLPDLESFLTGKKHLKVFLRACDGVGKVELDYPISNLEFSASSFKLEKCIKKLPVKVTGNLSLKGKAKLDSNKLLLKSGRGNFALENLKIGELSLGLFSIPSLNLGSIKGTYTVKRDNVIDLEAEGNGSDAEVSVKGYINADLKNPERSYLNLRVKVKPKVAPLKGRIFSFRIKGFVENVKVAR
jgi:type II secretion system protein N